MSAARPEDSRASTAPEGRTSARNSQYLYGINVGDPSPIGAAGFYYDFAAFEEIQVSTGAHDITVPTRCVSSTC